MPSATSDSRPGGHPGGAGAFRENRRSGNASAPRHASQPRHRGLSPPLDRARVPAERAWRAVPEFARIALSWVALRYSLIKPGTTCLPLIRAAISTTWPSSTAEAAVPATGAVVVLYVDEKLQARRWNGLRRCCRGGRASLKAQPRLHPAWATTSVRCAEGRDVGGRPGDQCLLSHHRHEEFRTVSKYGLDFPGSRQRSSLARIRRPAPS
jgi:hypothetical protein